MHQSLVRKLSVLMWVVVSAAGCASTPTKIGPTTRPGGQWVESVAAMCYPPAGWTAEPLKSSSRHSHQVWVSPTRSTAYGVIHFSLPFPMTDDLVLWGFMREMKRSEGAAELVSREAAPDLPGLRFIAKGGLYYVRVNLMSKGWEGWAVYAGTKVDRPIDPAEVSSAQIARDNTAVRAKN